ncbi:MAG: 3-keto-5-aminohexanoate cleavage protein [Thermoleophilia bacterium]
MDKLIITVAPTGAITTLDDTPHLPIRPVEIIEEICRAHEAGASIAHIHTRDAEGRACMDFDQFAEIVSGVRARCDIIINITSSGGLNLGDDERIRPLAELEPELASFDSGSVNFGTGVFVNTPPFLDRLAGVMHERGVKPEIEVFETGFIANALKYVEDGLFQPPLHFQFVLGVPGAMPATPRNLVHLVDTIPAGSTWSVIGIGKGHLPMATMAIHMGGHVRVGMEDNVYYRKGVLARSNAEFVERVVRLAAEFERPVATPAEARQILGL